MNTPNPAPTEPADPDGAPTTAPGTTAADTDQALTRRATTSGDWIAGLIAYAMLDTAGTPTNLPHLTFPDDDPDTVTRVWQAALAVGFRAGRLDAAPRFHRDTLARHQAALADAGYTAMAALGQQTLTLLPPPPQHPADPDHTDVRGGHE